MGKTTMQEWLILESLAARRTGVALRGSDLRVARHLARRGLVRAIADYTYQITTKGDAVVQAGML